MSRKFRLHRPPRGALLSLLAVFVGGSAGTLLRITIDALLPHADDQFPLSTLIVNVVGSFGLGWLVARLWPSATAVVKAGLGPGLLGGFTTFSAVIISLISLSTAGRFWLGAVYLALTLLLGFSAAAAGIFLGARQLGTDPRTGEPIEVDE